MKALQLYFKILDKLSPTMAARKMYTVMTNPRVRKLRDFEEQVLNEAEQKSIPFKGFEIQTYRWGSPGGKTALFVHGWEGQAGNFGSLVPILLDLGYQVVAYDAPAHGNSSKGKTNMFDIPELTGQFLEKYQPELVISH
ncbi:MAG: alpha/beta hydrolase, partial [Bacteroidota bacterium]